MMLPIDKALPLLAKPKKIVITTHFKPDGDAMGSSLGLYRYLSLKGHDVQVVITSEVPDFLMWLPHIDQVINYEALPAPALQAIANADLLFCLDFNRASRTKHLEQVIHDSNAIKLLIDHHLDPDLALFNYGMSDPAKSSTCEMVYDFICLNNDTDLIDQDIMQCLYTGLMTDTGSFRFPVTSASVHEMIAVFKHKGLEHAAIHQHVYDNYSINRLKLIGHLLNNLYIDSDNHFAILTLDKQINKSLAVSTGDAEGLVNYPLSVKNIYLSIMLTERDDEVKISFRSKGNINVSAFSANYFDGGGHFNAAGGSSKLTLDATILKIKELICSTQITNNHSI